MGKISLFSLVLALVTSAILLFAEYQINRDIVGWQARAQVSSEPNDMYEYMTNVKTGMEKWGMTRGYAALVFKTPDNDMSLIYRTVLQHVDQAKVLTTMDRTSPEYQTGLDNLRGSIRELDLHAFSYWVRHDGLLWNVVCWAGWILFLVFGVVWMIVNQ